MQKLSVPFRVLLSNGETKEGVARYIDMLKTERELGRGIRSATQSAELEVSLRTAHQALVRIGEYDKDFDTFMEELEGYEEISSEEGGSGEAPVGSSEPSVIEPVSLRVS